MNEITGETDDYEISSDCQTNAGNEEQRDRSKTGRTMVLLTFDEEESPIRHYYKRHFINRKRVISCQIDPPAFVKVRNYDGSPAYIHHVEGSRENSIGKYFASYNIASRVIANIKGHVKYMYSLKCKVDEKKINERELSGLGERSITANNGFY